MTGAAKETADDEIRLLAESADAFLARRHSLRRARERRFAEPGHDVMLWREMAELGWLGLALPEAVGGAGLGFRPLVALLEGLGGALLPEPYAVAAVVGGELIASGDNEALKAETLPQLIAGDLLPVPALQEREGDLEPARPTTRAEAECDGFRLTGMKRFVPAAASADLWLIPAMADDGPATFALDAAAPGLEVEKQRLVDGGFAATLRLDRTPVPGRRRLHSGAIAAPALERALDVAALAAAAEMVGIMDAAFSMTLDYLRTRVQFDRPIGSLQALQHRAADLRIQLELARASVEAAANALDAGADARARATAVSAAKARASEAALLITRQAIQLQGAIGYTEEADVGLYLKRAMVLANGFGTASAHRRRFAALAAPEQEEALT